ncbi:MAG: Gfo/Idh/MocA family oxidoreductase [Gammaproteobacteria bacterium]
MTPFSPLRLALQAQAWGERIPKTEADAKKLADKSAPLLEQYHAAKGDAAGKSASTTKRRTNNSTAKKRTSKSNAGASHNQRVPLAPPDKQPPDLAVPEPKRKVGWAVVGLGQLALEEVMPAFREAKQSEPVALVSGHPDKARKVAEVYGIDPKSIYDYENYDRLADNDRVEVIYIILPNSMHAEYTMRGLKAGKHVLCEKPLSATVEESERMIAAAKQANKKLMTAYRLHYEPFNQKVMELCRQKAIGELKLFSASNVQDVQAPNIRLSRELGGGPVGDVGVMCLEGHCAAHAGRARLGRHTDRHRN